MTHCAKRALVCVVAFAYAGASTHPANAANISRIIVQEPDAPPKHKLFIPNTIKGGVICTLQYPIILHGFANQTASNPTATVISIAQQAGANVVPYFPYFPNPDSDLPLINQFQNLGIRLMPLVDSEVENMFDSAKEAEFVAWINAVKNNPMIWGYFLYDEPEIRQNYGPVTAAKVQRAQTLIKQNDPNHPTTINFSNPNTAYYPYLGIADIASFDYYPVHGSGSYRTSMTEYYQLVDQFIADHATYDPTGKTKAFGTYVQAFRNDALGIREITQAEMQDMVNYARSRSAKFNQVTYFLDSWNGQETSYPGLRQIASLRTKASGVSAHTRTLPSLYAVKTNSPCAVGAGW